MKLSMLSIVMLSLTISIPTTSDAKVYKPDEVQECTKNCSVLDWDKVLVIDEETLKSLNADAKGYKVALEELVAAQKDLNDAIKELQGSTDVNLALLQHTKDLEITEWYASPSFWGSVGFVFGIVTATILYASLMDKS